MQLYEVVTPRQLEFLALFASGHQIGEIAMLKFVSYSTVKNDLYAAKNAAKAKSLTQLVGWLIDDDLLVPKDRHWYPVQDEHVIR